ncbi:MAG: RNA-binding transcriptional accessory protein [Anaerolineales bacterium]|nr:RNA-binding transcriptional accessory protein [Anaerolineales bacterium]MCB8950510.1 RNA-binding transcriptional accessory protein [Ardenticatenales bacterium]
MNLQTVAAQTNVRLFQVEAAVGLLDAGNTLPFIARYRKEATGGLDDEQLRQISRLLDSLRALEKRRQTILDSITAQGQITPELARQLHAATTLTELEDLYQPYKPKRRTRATVAREQGLQPLADLILAQPRSQESLDRLAAPFLNETIATADEAWAGARDIVAEAIGDHAGVRQQAREKALRWGSLGSSVSPQAADEKQVFQIYYDFQVSLSRLRPHQVLALNRGEREKVLRVRIDVPERDWRGALDAHFRPHPRSPLAEQLALAAEDAAKRLLLPAIERDIRRTLTEQAEAHAIHVFAVNLRKLLMQPPLAGQTVMGIDPGYRTGCKAAIVDPTGKVLETTTIYPHPPQRQQEVAARTVAHLARRHDVTLFAIGNGTASRETEQLVADLIQGGQVGEAQYLMVNEAGASVYSASELARAELPEMDVSMRGAVSIARRVQDPLAELVKIEPRAIGIGLYQHDVNQKQLAEALDGVVESVVNQVGVDVNTASPALLRYVAGIGPKLAQKIVMHRDEQGPFVGREELTQVSGLGPKAFEQAAGFLRVRQGDNPLDASAIHPESYALAAGVLARVGLTPTASLAEREAALAGWQERSQVGVLAEELNAGIPTLTDILEQLIRPGRDPRADLPAPLLRRDVLSLEDLRQGMRLQGTVRNVVDFGAFVDIGVKQDGLLHRGQWPRREPPGVGDIIDVTILQVEIERGRISLGWAD